MTTIWNYRSTVDAHDRRIATELAISKDKVSHTLWYRTKKPQAGELGKNSIAHWNGLQLALTSNMPITGILKDVETGRCSLVNVFDCNNPQYDKKTGDLWLQLVPRSEVGCDTKLIDIAHFTGYQSGKTTHKALNDEFQAAVIRSLNGTSQERMARLKSADKLPRKIEVSATVFERNPDVVAEALFQAAGVCQLCKKPAPFTRRKDGTPYLEVHHIIMLANDGEDTIENAQAVCPNCHRAAHYA